MSFEIRPLSALYPLPHTKNVLNLGIWYAHAYGSYAPFYYINLKNIWEGGYNDARGLISGNIATNSIIMLHYESIIFFLNQMIIHFCLSKIFKSHV